jgi:hypothetical protein
MLRVSTGIGLGLSGRKLAAPGSPSALEHTGISRLPRPVAGDHVDVRERQLASTNTGAAPASEHDSVPRVSTGIGLGLSGRKLAASGSPAAAERTGPATSEPDRVPGIVASTWMALHQRQLDTAGPSARQGRHQEVASRLQGASSARSDRIARAGTRLGRCQQTTWNPSTL